MASREPVPAPQFDTDAPLSSATPARFSPAAGMPPSSTASTAPIASPSATSHASGQLLGIVAFAVGIGILALSYIWGYHSVQSTAWELHGNGLTRPVTEYEGWGTHRLLFVLFLLLIGFVGWLAAGLGAGLYAGRPALPNGVNSAVAQGRGAGRGPGVFLGALTFAGGIGLVVLVFLTASQHFGNSGNLVPATASPGGSVAPDYLGWAANGIYRILALGVMALNAALVAGRGIRLFLGSLGRF